MEFKNTRVKFVSLHNILEEADLESDGMSNGSRKSIRINLCKVVERFIRSHKDAHLFIDEFPLTYERSDADESFLNCIKERSASNRYFWLTLRLCDVRNIFFEELNENKNHYETFLKNCGFEVPFLKHNMRNSSFIVDSFETIYGYGEKKYDDGKKRKYDDEKETKGMGKKDAKLMVDKAILPPNTVQGMKTVVVPVQGNSRADYKDPFDALSYVLNTYFKDASEPVVVLITESKYFETENKKYFERINRASSESKRTFLVYPFKRPSKVPAADIDNLEKYIESPEGVLLTDAEAFNGMQARNVVIISDGSRMDRNYIMRANSFVVFIQKRQEVNTKIASKPNILLDKTFLPDKIKKSKDGTIGKRTNTVWLWHFPFNVQEKDVKEHLETMKLDISTLKIEELFYPPLNSNMLNLPDSIQQNKKEEIEKAKKVERQFVGFAIELLLDTSPIHFEDISRGENNFWPPGWSSKSYSGVQDINNDAKRRSFTYSTEPSWIKVSVKRYSGLHESDIKKYVKSQVK